MEKKFKIPESKKREKRHALKIITGKYVTKMKVPDCTSNLARV